MFLNKMLGLALKRRDGENLLQKAAFSTPIVRF